MNRTRHTLTAAAVAALALSGAGAAGAAPQTVPGNNGTIKANVPAGSCTVDIDWYGMDADAVTTIEFRLHGPSGDALLLSDTLTLDADGAHGGNLDGSRSYDLGGPVAAYGDPTDSRYQVKVTTHTTYAQGADTKHKVVHVAGCVAVPPDDGPNE